MKVTVTQGIQVVHDGQVYLNGASADVPDALGQRWIRNGWASEDGLSALPDPRGLGKSQTEPDVYSLGALEAKPAGAACRAAPSPDTEVDKSSGPGPAKPRAQRRTRRDPRKAKAGNNDDE